jgi:hypothetical protein
MGVTDAILLERNKLTSGTTWHSAAQVRALRNSRNLTRMIQYSVDLYSQLEQETGQSVGWFQKGSLSIATNPDRLTHIKRQEALAHAYGLGSFGEFAALRMNGCSHDPSSEQPISHNITKYTYSAPVPYQLQNLGSQKTVALPIRWQHNKSSSPFGKRYVSVIWRRMDETSESVIF